MEPDELMMQRGAFKGGGGNGSNCSSTSSNSNVIDNNNSSSIMTSTTLLMPPNCSSSSSSLIGRPDQATMATPIPGPAPNSVSSRYESQKRRDWRTFGQYLRNHRPPLALARCSGAHVLEFLRYLDQFGKTKVHMGPGTCPFYGQPSPPAACACPLRQAWGSLDALVGRLRAAFEESGAARGRPESNPFGARAVRLYLREVREAQAKARGIPYEKKKRRNAPAKLSTAGPAMATIKKKKKKKKNLCPFDRETSPALLPYIPEVNAETYRLSARSTITSNASNNNVLIPSSSSSSSSCNAPSSTSSTHHHPYPTNPHHHHGMIMSYNHPHGLMMMPDPNSCLHDQLYLMNHANDCDGQVPIISTSLSTNHTYHGGKGTPPHQTLMQHNVMVSSTNSSSCAPITTIDHDHLMHTYDHYYHAHAHDQYHNPPPLHHQPSQQQHYLYNTMCRPSAPSSDTSLLNLSST